jgi:hypothetical protein
MCKRFLYVLLWARPEDDNVNMWARPEDDNVNKLRHVACPILLFVIQD